jgi:dipeptidase E
MGGGGFAMEPANPTLDRYVLELGRARRPDPRICLLPTAGGDSEEQIFRFYAAFSDEACEPTHLSLFRLGRRPVSLRTHLLDQDVVYVGGGSMLNMLVIWRAHGIDRVMREAWNRGVVLGGQSAGSMCWFERGVTTSSGRPEPATGLGFLRGSNSV